MNFLIEKQLDFVRGLYNRWMRRRDMKVPEDVVYVPDVCQSERCAETEKIDVFYSRGTAEKRPVIVDIHGGGMVLCDRKTNVPFCAQLARRGFLVFSIEYPLAPQTDVPGILRHVARRLDAVADLIPQWNGDERIYLVGDSAGAFLGAYELAAQKNEDIAAALDLTPSLLQIRAAGFISGMFYTTRNDKNCMFLRRDFYGKNWKTHPFSPYYDPAVPAVAENLPPCYLVTSYQDMLRQYTLDFARGLKACGIPYHVTDWPGNRKLIHDFVIMNPTCPEAQKSIDEMCKFLLQY